MIIHKLLHLLHFGNITNESLVIHVIAETPQLVEVTDEVLTNSLFTKKLEKVNGRHFSFQCYPCEVQYVCLNTANLGDDLSQPGVAHNQPAAGSDAVGLVLELMWLHFIEVLETAGRVKRRIYQDTHMKSQRLGIYETDTTTYTTHTCTLYWCYYDLPL